MMNEQKREWDGICSRCGVQIHGNSNDLFIECDSGEEWYFLFMDELWDLFELEVED